MKRNQFFSQIETYATQLHQALMAGNACFRRAIIANVAAVGEQLQPQNGHQQEIREAFLAVVRRLESLAKTLPVSAWKESWDANLALLLHFRNIAVGA